MVDRVVRALPLRLPIAWECPWWCVLMGVEHERIHLETSSVLIRQLPLRALLDRPFPFWARCPHFSASADAPANELLPVADVSKLVTLGEALRSDRQRSIRVEGLSEADARCSAVLAEVEVTVA